MCLSSTLLIPALFRQDALASRIWIVSGDIEDTARPN